MSGLISLDSSAKDKGGVNVNIELLLMPVYTLFAHSAFNLLRLNDKRLVGLMDTFFGKAVKAVGDCSLEIYYVQFLWIDLLKGLLFPVNFILIVLFIVLTALLLNIVSGRICKGIIKLANI